MSAPAYYARSTGRGGLGDWWSLLHPPYTAWHLSYVVIGAVLAPQVDGGRLAATVGAFALALGVAAHALDEMHGRPLRTGIPAGLLVGASVLALAGAVALGLVVVGLWILPWAVVGVVLVVGYDLELAGGVLHNTAGFAAAWGAYPVLVGYVAQTHDIRPAAVAAAVAAFALSCAQRVLSTQARELRRRTAQASARLVRADGTIAELDGAALLAPYERALRALVWATVALAVTGVLARFA